MADKSDIGREITMRRNTKVKYKRRLGEDVF